MSPGKRRCILGMAGKHTTAALSLLPVSALSIAIASSLEPWGFNYCCPLVMAGMVSATVGILSGAFSGTAPVSDWILVGIFCSGFIYFAPRPIISGFREMHFFFLDSIPENPGSMQSTTQSPTRGRVQGTTTGKRGWTEDSVRKSHLAGLVTELSCHESIWHPRQRTCSTSFWEQ